ncbi:beta-lactamase hydrolase-like protein [Abditibacteriota bacterium]|nr:beta-lactamase hydrolase-like protein [Abditibacteriota bacterium]
MQKTNWNNRISIGSALEEGDAQKLHDEGIRTVIDLRTNDEINPAEKSWVEGVGLDYELLPTSPQLLDDAAVMRFIQEVDASSGPVYIHCKMGGRAGIMALLHDAVAGGWTIEKTMQVAQEKDVKLGDDSPYVDFVQDYLERHSAGERLKRG